MFQLKQISAIIPGINYLTLRITMKTGVKLLNVSSLQKLFFCACSIFLLTSCSTSKKGKFFVMLRWQNLLNPGCEGIKIFNNYSWRILLKMKAQWLGNFFYCSSLNWNTADTIRWKFIFHALKCFFPACIIQKKENQYFQFVPYYDLKLFYIWTKSIKMSKSQAKSI